MFKLLSKKLSSNHKNTKTSNGITNITESPSNNISTNMDEDIKEQSISVKMIDINNNDIDIKDSFNDNDNDGFDDEFDDNDDFSDNNDDWDDVKLEFGQQIKSAFNDDDEDPQIALQRALEKKRLEQSDKNKFWNCGKCQFLNHPSRAICMSCQMPQLDIVHHVLTCKDKLKTCPNCKALVIPIQYEDHIDTCHPMPGIDGKNQNWYCDLTICEKKAIIHATDYAMKKSNQLDIKKSLLDRMKSINNEYNEDILKKLQLWLEWQVPITIRVHVGKLIPKLLKDTKYRNLFEIGTGSGGNDKNRRKLEEGKMFGTVYDKAKATERPKYGCLNVGLQPEGDQHAKGYGDGYFLMNDTTIRWRSTLTVSDSFNVNGNCGTLKHCLHLLNELDKNELQELIEAAVFKKKGGQKQRAYREIQIHGPVILNRDIVSMHCPKNQMKHKKIFDQFCQKNGCKLIWF